MTSSRPRAACIATTNAFARSYRWLPSRIATSAVSRLQAPSEARPPRGFVGSSASLAPTIAELLKAHPWPRDFADARKLEFLWTVEVPVTPDVLWPLLADLSRLNRALKLPQMTFVERDGVRWGTAIAELLKAHPWPRDFAD